MVSFTRSKQRKMATVEDTNNIETPACKKAGRPRTNKEKEK